MSDTRTIEQKLAAVFAEVWDMYNDDRDLANVDMSEFLSEVLQISGLAEWRPCTGKEPGFTRLSLDVGEMMLLLTDEGKRAIALTNEEQP